MSPCNNLQVRGAQASAPDSSAKPVRLESVGAAESLLRRLLERRYDGELVLRGHGTARICLFEGRVAWLRLTDYPEHLGNVMRRELGIGEPALRAAIEHCRATGMLFGEGLVALGVVQPSELRSCLYRHLSDQLWELLDWPGELTVEQCPWPHRYDHAYTFEVDALLERPALPTAVERDLLTKVVEQCHRRLPDLSLACVIEAEEGTVLHTDGTDTAAEDLLSLCTAEIRRLATNRITRDDSAPQSMMLSSAGSCLVIQHLAWRLGWLLLLGGRQPPGLLLSVANTATKPTGPGARPGPVA